MPARSTPAKKSSPSGSALAAQLVKGLKGEVKHRAATPKLREAYLLVPAGSKSAAAVLLVQRKGGVTLFVRETGAIKLVKQVGLKPTKGKEWATSTPVTDDNADAVKQLLVALTTTVAAAA